MERNKNSKLLIIFKYLFSLLFALFLVWLLFRNQDPVILINKISEADFKWVILSMIFGGLAYFSRGLRWILLIEALGYRSSKIHSIASVSIGYFTNLFVPRAGEISRCTALSRSEKIPVDKLFGTILIERVIDFIFLILLFLLTVLLKFEMIISFFNELSSHTDEKSSNDNYVIIFGSIFIFLIALFTFLKFIQNTKLYNKILKFFEGLKEGFRSIRKMKRRMTFWIHTFIIWIMYFLMTYICFYALEETSHLGISDGLFLLVLGGIGMVIPTPGGIGSYHAIVMIGLSVLGVGTIVLSGGGDPSNPALLFPTIVHTAQTLVAIILGSLSLIILFFSKRDSNNEKYR